MHNRPLLSAYFNSLLLRSGIVFVLLSFVAGLSAEDKKICLTFDDLPHVGPLGFWRPREISGMILKTLQEHGIKAAGFVVEEKIDEDTSTYIILEDWVTQGHIVGNHTYSHVDLHQLEVEDFLHHVSDGQKYLWKVSKAHRSNYRYLRFPYLHEGETLRKKREVARTLRRAGYEIVPVTVMMSDLAFNEPFIEFERDAEKIARLKAIYLDHIGKSLDYAEKQSQAVFSRNIPHILWLHDGIATASFLNDLIVKLKERGYQFISLPEALADSVFQPQKEPIETYVGPESLSFIDRVAATRGLPYDGEHAALTEEEIKSRLSEPRASASGLQTAP